MPHAASVMISSDTAVSVLQNASGKRAGAVSGSRPKDTFAALFREKTASTEEAATGESTWKKLQVLIPEATASAAKSSVVHTKAAGAPNAFYLQVAESVIGGADTESAAQSVGRGVAAEHKVTDIQAADSIAGANTKTGLRAMAVETETNAVSATEAKADATTSSSAEGTSKRHKSKEGASTSGMAEAIPQGVTIADITGVAAPTPLPGCYRLAAATMTPANDGHTGDVVSAGGLMMVNSGQTAQNLSVSMTHADDMVATQQSNAAAKDTVASVNASDACTAGPERSMTVPVKLHAGQAAVEHETPDHSPRAAVPVEARLVNSVPMQHDSHADAIDRSLLPQAVQSAAVPDHAANGVAVMNPNTTSPFDRIDQGVSSVVLRAGSQHVEVGVHDPQLGWVEISAQNAAGHVDARLVAASSQTHSALAAQLPAIAQYLQERDVRVGTLVVHHPGAQAGGDGQAGGQSGSHTGSQAGSGGGQRFQGNNADARANENPAAGMSRTSPASLPYMTESVALGPVSYISVRA